MCGRYALDGENEPQRRAMQRALGWMKLVHTEPAQRYWGFDCRPTTRRAVFMQGQEGIEMVGARWGWTRPFLGKRPLINARHEDLKPMFNAAIRERRCVVPASAYYEWRRDANDKPLAKYAFREASADLLLIAGLWEDAKVDEGEGTERRFLVLTRAMDRYVEIHDRTPVMLTPAAAECWMDPKATAAEVVEAASSRTDHDLVVRSVVSGPSKAVPEGAHLMHPTDEPWPW